MAIDGLVNRLMFAAGLGAGALGLNSSAYGAEARANEPAKQEQNVTQKYQRIPVELFPDPMPRLRGSNYQEYRQSWKNILEENYTGVKNTPLATTHLLDNLAESTEMGQGKISKFGLTESMTKYNNYISLLQTIDMKGFTKEVSDHLKNVYSQMFYNPKVDARVTDANLELQKINALPQNAFVVQIDPEKTLADYAAAVFPDFNSWSGDKQKQLLDKIMSDNPLNTARGILEVEGSTNDPFKKAFISDGSYKVRFSQDNKQLDAFYFLRNEAVSKTLLIAPATTYRVALK